MLNMQSWPQLSPFGAFPCFARAQPSAKDERSAEAFPATKWNGNWTTAVPYVASIAPPTSTPASPVSWPVWQLQSQPLPTFKWDSLQQPHLPDQPNSISSKLRWQHHHGDECWFHVHPCFPSPSSHACREFREGWKFEVPTCTASIPKYSRGSRAAELSQSNAEFWDFQSFLSWCFGSCWSSWPRLLAERIFKSNGTSFWLQ